MIKAKNSSGKSANLFEGKIQVFEDGSIKMEPSSMTHASVISAEDNALIEEIITTLVSSMPIIERLELAKKTYKDALEEEELEYVDIGFDGSVKSDNTYRDMISKLLVYLFAVCDKNMGGTSNQEIELVLKDIVSYTLGDIKSVRDIPRWSYSDNADEHDLFKARNGKFILISIKQMNPSLVSQTFSGKGLATSVSEFNELKKRASEMPIAETLIIFDVNGQQIHLGDYPYDDEILLSVNAKNILEPTRDYDKVFYEGMASPIENAAHTIKI